MPADRVTEAAPAPPLNDGLPLSQRRAVAADLPVAAPAPARIAELREDLRELADNPLAYGQGTHGDLHAEAHFILDALLVERQQAAGCPAGNECAINSGACHCFHCRRNWPRDETWEQPFLDRPNLQRRDIAALDALLDKANRERLQAEERNERLTVKLGCAVSLAEQLFQMIPAEAWRDHYGVVAPDGQNEGDDRAEQTHAELESLRAVLAGEEDAE